MPLTRVDPATALLHIGLQKGIAQMVGRELLAPAVRNALRLAGAFREHSLPVVLVNAAGCAPGPTGQSRPAQPFPSDWTELLPEFGKLLERS